MNTAKERSSNLECSDFIFFCFFLFSSLQTLKGLAATPSREGRGQAPAVLHRRQPGGGAGGGRGRHPRGEGRHAPRGADAAAAPGAGRLLGVQRRPAAAGRHRVPAGGLRGGHSLC